MNFNDSPQESIYRATVREWLANNAPRYTVSRRAPEAERLGIARAWQACKAAAGYARVSWPRDWGGAGGTTIQQMIFSEEEASRR
jgi:alkylation response protein AidB-like acyl-CoA dehydrogenase